MTENREKNARFGSCRGLCRACPRGFCPLPAAPPPWPLLLLSRYRGVPDRREVPGPRCPRLGALSRFKNPGAALRQCGDSRLSLSGTRPPASLSGRVAPSRFARAPCLTARCRAAPVVGDSFPVAGPGRCHGRGGAAQLPGERPRGAPGALRGRRRGPAAPPGLARPRAGGSARCAGNGPALLLPWRAGGALPRWDPATGGSSGTRLRGAVCPGRFRGCAACARSAARLGLAGCLGCFIFSLLPAL